MTRSRRCGSGDLGAEGATRRPIVGVHGQGVSAAAAGVSGGVPGQGGADAATLVCVGDLECEVDDAGFLAEPPGGGQGEGAAGAVEQI